MKCNTPIALALSLIVASTLNAAPLTLNDLIKDAIINSPDIKISKAQYEAAEQRSSQADADYLPQVNLVGEIGKQNVDYGTQKVGIPPEEIEPGENETNLLAGKVTAKQLIYDFGKTTGNMESFSQEAAASKAAMQQTLSEKIFAVKNSYYNVLYSYALIDVNKENVALNEHQLYRAERYFEAGIRTKVDVTDAKVNLIEAQLTLQDAGYETRLAVVDLKKEVGFDSESREHEQSLHIDSPDLNNLYATLPKLSLPVSSYKEEAYKQRAELEQYAQLLKSAQSKHKKADGDYYPDLYANGDYMIQDVDDNAFAPEEQWKATLSLEWNLFAGNRTTAQSQEAKANIMKAQADLDNAKLRIQKEVDDAYITVNKQLDNAKLSESLSIAAKEKFQQVQKQYEYGLSDYIELQQARQSYIDSRARLAQSYYRYYIAMAELDRAVGK